MMGQHRASALAVAILAGTLVPAVMLGGCTLLTSLDGLSGGPDDSPDSAACSTCDGGVDGGGQAEGSSSSGDGSMTIGDAAKADAADSSTIPPGSFLCGAGNVKSCADCPGSPEPCITCDGSGQTSTPFCAAPGANCRDVAAAPYKNGCNCSGGAATCPGAFQVCHNNQFCHTCGEPLSSGEPCKTGGVCSGTTCM